MKEAREEEDRLINKQALKVQRSHQKMEKNYLHDHWKKELKRIKDF